MKQTPCIHPLCTFYVLVVFLQQPLVLSAMPQAAPQADPQLPMIQREPRGLPLLQRANSFHDRFFGESPPRERRGFPLLQPQNSFWRRYKKTVSRDVPSADPLPSIRPLTRPLNQQAQLLNQNQQLSPTLTQSLPDTSPPRGEVSTASTCETDTWSDISTYSGDSHGPPSQSGLSSTDSSDAACVPFPPMPCSAQSGSG